MDLTPLAQRSLPESFKFTESILDLANVADKVGHPAIDSVFLDNPGLSVSTTSAYLTLLHSQVVSLVPLPRSQQTVISCYRPYRAGMPQRLVGQPVLRQTAMRFSKRFVKLRLRLDSGLELILDLCDVADEPPRLHIKGELDAAWHQQSLRFLEEQLRILFPCLTVVHSANGAVPGQGAHGKLSD